MDTYRRVVPLLVGAVPGAILLACSTSAPPPGQATQVTSTLQAVSTQAAPTVAALVPTARAVSTQVSATAQSVGAQTAPTAQAVSSTVSAAAPIHITSVQRSTNDSTITLQNTSQTPVDLSGWQLQVGTANAPLPSGMQVPPGASVMLHTGTGTTTPSDVYLGPPAQSLVANLQPGAQVVLQSPNGPVTAFSVPGA
jgi:Lamin Tail Domain